MDKKLDIYLTKLKDNDPPELYIWNENEFNNSFLIHIRNPERKAIILKASWIIQLNFYCGKNAGALVDKNEVNKITYEVESAFLSENVNSLLFFENMLVKNFQLKENYTIESGDEIVIEIKNVISHTQRGKALFLISYGTLGGNIETLNYSISKIQFSLKINQFFVKEDVGPNYSAPVFWDTEGADVILLNQSIVDNSGTKGIFLDRNECEKNGYISVELVIKNKYDVSLKQSINIIPSGPLLLKKEIKGIDKKYSDKYCYWEILYADKIIYNGELGYSMIDQGKCLRKSGGHIGGPTSTKFYGTLEAIGFKGKSIKVEYEVTEHYPAII